MTVAQPTKRARRKKGDPPRSHFEKVRDELHWSSRDVAQQIGATSAIVDRWATHDTAPLLVMQWMEGLAAFHKAFPPPTDWKGRRKKRPASLHFPIAKRDKSVKMHT